MITETKNAHLKNSGLLGQDIFSVQHHKLTSVIFRGLKVSSDYGIQCRKTKVFIFGLQVSLYVSIILCRQIHNISDPFRNSHSQKIQSYTERNKSHNPETLFQYRFKYSSQLYSKSIPD